MELKIFLQETEYIDFSSPIIQRCAQILFVDMGDDIEKAKTAFHFVRDKIPHSFDVQAAVINAKASDVLKHKTGICHAKANLLAALLRTQGIVGMCFQHLTLADDDSLGYCVHCYNAIYLNNHWVKVDARGNKHGINAQFSLEKPILAFPVRSEYDEYLWKGIYAGPHIKTMKMLEKAASIQDIIENIPDDIDDMPEADVLE